MGRACQKGRKLFIYIYIMCLPVAPVASRWESKTRSKHTCAGR